MILKQSTYFLALAALGSGTGSCGGTRQLQDDSRIHAFAFVSHNEYSLRLLVAGVLDGEKKGGIFLLANGQGSQASPPGQAVRLHIGGNGIEGRWRVTLSSGLRVRMPEGANSKEIVDGQTSGKVTLPLIIDLTVEGIRVSQNPGDQTLVFTFQPDGGERAPLSDRLVATVGTIALEPVTVDHEPTGAMLNSGVVVKGRSARYRVKIAPPTLPEAGVRWKSSGPGLVLGGAGQGRTVEVLGVEEGNYRLQVEVDGLKGPLPSIDVDVQVERQIPIQAYVILDDEGKPTRSDESIGSLLQGANLVLEQAGLSLKMGGPIIKLQEPQWVDIEGEELRQLTSRFFEPKKLEVYFVANMAGAAGFYVPDFGRPEGLVLAGEANARTLAHEVGHAVGLGHIYDCDQVGNSTLTQFVRQEWLKDDWNSGKDPFYYPDTLSHQSLIRRLLMYALYEDVSSQTADLPRGRVYGYVNAANGRVLREANVGIRDIKRE